MGCSRPLQEEREDPRAFPPLVKEQSFSFVQTLLQYWCGGVLFAYSQDSHRSASHSSIPQSIIAVTQTCRVPSGGEGPHKKK